MSLESTIGRSLIQRIEDAGRKPVSRGEFFVALGIIGGAVAIKSVVQDYVEAEEEVNRQFELSHQFEETLRFMSDIKVTLPQDTLFGFIFPSPKEIAEDFIKRLQQTLIDPENPQLYVVQETPVKQWTRRLRQFLNIEPKNHCSVGAVVYHRASPDQPDWMYLPEDFPNRSMVERAITLYHEGLHLFDPEAGYSEDDIKRENKATIGTILLERVLMGQKKHIIPLSDQDLSRGYEKAVANNNPGIWKEALLSLSRESTEEVHNTPLCR